MKPLKLLLLGCMLFLRLTSEGQGSGVILHLDTNVESLIPSIVHEYDSGTYALTIKNVGNAIFSGQLALSSNIGGNSPDTGAYQGCLGLEYETYMINPGDSVNEFITFHFNGPLFTPGSSVVVIWPYILSGGARWDDSIVKAITILQDTAAGIRELATGKLNVYCFSNQLHIIYDPGNGPGYVRIFETTGALLTAKTITGPDNVISMSDYASGLYYVEVTLPDNSRKSYKIFNLNK